MRVEARASLGITPEEVVVLMVSRALRSKGIVELIDAAKRSREEGRSICFILAGAAEEEHVDGIAVATLRQAERDTRFKWLGRREDIRTLMIAADIFAFPSFYGEGTPRACLEAMAAAKPIITTDSPGCREVVRDQENGFLIPPRDAAALYERIVQMALCPDMRHKMGARGMELAAERFDAEVVADRIIRELYGLE